MEINEYYPHVKKKSLLSRAYCRKGTTTPVFGGDSKGDNSVERFIAKVEGGISQPGLETAEMQRLGWGWLVRKHLL